MRDENQLHAAVVELVRPGRRRDQVLDRAELVSRRQGRQGRHLQLRHQARQVPGPRSKISWTQVETGSAITWKYPSCILQGRRLDRRVLLGGPDQQLPAGRHRHQDDPHRQEHAQHDHLQGHLGRPRPEHLSRPGEGLKGGRTRARNYSQCDSMLIGDQCGAHTFPYIDVKNPTARSSTRPRPPRSARTSSSTAISAASRPRTRSTMIVNGFCKEVFRELPMEFAVEAQKLLAVSLEGSVG